MSCNGAEAYFPPDHALCNLRYFLVPRRGVGDEILLHKVVGATVCDDGAVAFDNPRIGVCAEPDAVYLLRDVIDRQHAHDGGKGSSSHLDCPCEMYDGLPRRLGNNRLVEVPVLALLQDGLHIIAGRYVRAGTDVVIGKPFCVYEHNVVEYGVALVLMCLEPCPRCIEVPFLHDVRIHVVVEHSVEVFEGAFHDALVGGGQLHVVILLCLLYILLRNICD